MNYMIGAIFIGAVGLLAYQAGGRGASALVVMTFAGVILGVATLCFILLEQQTRRTASARMVRLLQEHPLTKEDATAVDPILDMPAAAITPELVTLITQRVEQWKAWHPLQESNA